MKRDEKLYNVLFPLWFLLLVPISWLIVIPANFVIDPLALLLTEWKRKSQKILFIFGSFFYDK